MQFAMEGAWRRGEKKLERILCVLCFSAVKKDQAAMDLWHKVATPRKEVREGRSFNPDEFAIALEQVVAGTAPEDYRDPEKFFSRTCFTRALIGPNAPRFRVKRAALRKMRKMKFD